MLFLNNIISEVYHKQFNLLYFTLWFGLTIIMWYGGIAQAAQICPNTTYGIWNGTGQATYSGCKTNGSSTFGLRINGTDVKEFMDPIQYVNPSVTLVIDTGSYQSFKVVDKGLGYTGDCTEILPGGGVGSVPAVVNHVYCHILGGTLGVAVTRATWTGSSFSNSLATFLINTPNTLPTFTTTEITSINEDSLYNYSITTNDVDGDSLIITAPTIPTWLSFTDNNNGTATLSGTPTNNEVGSYNVILNVSDNSVSTNQSFTITVNNINDAPVLDFSETPILTTIDEDDLTNTGTSIHNIIDSVSSVPLDMITDVDSSALKGIAVITVDNTNGSWEFSTDTGSTWTAFGTVSESTARLLTSNAASLIRFIPNADFNGTVNISFRAWDQTSGSNGGTANTSINDGITAFSSNTETASLIINPINDAPIFTSTEIITIDEDSPYNYAITTDDIDGDGLTITAPTKPAWLNFTDNGDGTATLSNIPTNDEVGLHDITLRINDGSVDVDQSFTITVVNTNDAPIFTSTEITIIDEDSLYNYSVITDDVDVGDSLTITALTKPSWLNFTDNGDGTATLTSTPTNDEVGSFNIVLQVNDATVNVEQSFTITVNNTNDAPVLDFNAELSLMTINEDNFTSNGISINSVIDSMSLDIITDVDGEMLEGLAIINVDNSNGNWEFSTDTGSTWTAFGNISESTARLLDSDNSNKIRFIPNADFNGNVNISFRAWDQTSGSNGETADVRDNGESTAFSADAETASITINPVNDSPIFTSIAKTVATEKLEYYYDVIIYDLEQDILYS
ncbi:MAG: hypothetical protein IMF12_10850, partial [Proteobacteria bacterium]|nr:hypothetical protein [Pseudomonadota bacterium]